MRVRPDVGEAECVALANSGFVKQTAIGQCDALAWSEKFNQILLTPHHAQPVVKAYAMLYNFSAE